MRKILFAVAAVFLVAAGTFGTLWVVERGGHRDVTDQLTVVRAEVDATKAKMGESGKKLKDLEATLTAAVNDENQAYIENRQNRICADNTRGAVKAAAVRNLQGLQESLNDLYANCE